MPSVELVSNLKKLEKMLYAHASGFLNIVCLAIFFGADIYFLSDFEDYCLGSQCYRGFLHHKTSFYSNNFALLKAFCGVYSSKHCT